MGSSCYVLKWLLLTKEIEGSMNDILQLQSLWFSEKFQMSTGTVQMGTWFSSINLNRAFGPWHPSRWQQFTFVFFFWGDLIGFCHDQLPNRSNVERDQLLGLMVSNVLVSHGGSWGSRKETHTEARKQDGHFLFLPSLNPSRVRSSSLGEFSLQVPAQKHPKAYFNNLVGVLWSGQFDNQR